MPYCQKPVRERILGLVSEEPAMSPILHWRTKTLVGNWDLVRRKGSVPEDGFSRRVQKLKAHAGHEWLGAQLMS